MEVYFCDYTKPALEVMKKHGITNDDIQEIFNSGITDSQSRKTLERNGFKTGILYQYDGHSQRYVIISVFRRPLPVKKR